MKLNIPFIFILLASQILCGYKPGRSIPPPEGLFKATRGNFESENESYRWINTCGGSITLFNSIAFEGVSTDQDVDAECSSIGKVWSGGELWTNQTNISGDACVGCSARIKCSDICGTLWTGGDLHAEESSFYQDVSICGNVSAECCEFNGTLSTCSEIITLSNVTANDIYVYPRGPSFDIQILYLKNDTVVHGDVYFASGRGKVLRQPSCLIEGDIYGERELSPYECHKYLDLCQYF
jgi:hypothetical protein